MTFWNNETFLHSLILLIQEIQILRDRFIQIYLKASITLEYKCSQMLSVWYDNISIRIKELYFVNNKIIFETVLF